MTVPVATAQDVYILGAGDTIAISVFGQEELSIETLLSNSSKINYPFLGEIDATGMSTEQLSRHIEAGLKGDYLVNPDVYVHVLAYRSFYILGEVKIPGGYPFQPGITINQAVRLAGGLTDLASLESIFIIEVNNSDNRKQASLAYKLSAGDTITIEKEEKQFYILGEIKKPGSYPFHVGITVHNAIALAGGLTDSASTDQIFFYAEEDQLNKQRILLDQFIQIGDTIEIIKGEQYFYILGQVNRPGAYLFQPGITVKQAVALAGGLTQYAFLKKIYLTKESDRNNETLITLTHEIFVGDTIEIRKRGF